MDRIIDIYTVAAWCSLLSPCDPEDMVALTPEDMVALTPEDMVALTPHLP